MLTAPSRAALAAHPPRVVFFGIGLCGRGAVSAGAPFDALGMALIAVRIARLLDVPIVVLLADAHAKRAGAPADRVDALADRWTDVFHRLATVSRTGPWQIVRASALHQTALHRFSLRTTAALSVPADDVYLRLQTADVLALRAQHGALAKVGWAMSARGGAHDETRFDAPVRRLLKDDLTCIYTRAGRTWDPECPRIAPYIATAAPTRLLLSPEEDPSGKTRAHAAISSTNAAVRNHLKAIVRLWSRTIAPVTGPLEARVAAVYQALFPERGPRVVDRGAP